MKFSLYENGGAEKFVVYKSELCPAFFHHLYPVLHSHPTCKTYCTLYFIDQEPLTVLFLLAYQEVSVGILANMACNQEVCTKIGKSAELM